MPKDDTPGAPAPAAAGSGRGLRLALILSVALNLAVAGVVAGALLRGDPAMRSPRDLGFGPLGQALSEADRRALRRAFLLTGPDLQAERRALREDMVALAAALRVDPPDPVPLKATLDRMSARMSAMQSLGRTLILDHVLALTAAERRALADRLEAAAARRGHPHRSP